MNISFMYVDAFIDTNYSIHRAATALSDVIGLFVFWHSRIFKAAPFRTNLLRKKLFSFFGAPDAFCSFQTNYSGLIYTIRNALYYCP